MTSLRMLAGPFSMALRKLSQASFHGSATNSTKFGSRHSAIRCLRILAQVRVLPLELGRVPELLASRPRKTNHPLPARQIPMAISTSGRAAPRMIVISGSVMRLNGLAERMRRGRGRRHMRRRRRPNYPAAHRVRLGTSMITASHTIRTSAARPPTATRIHSMLT